MNIFLLLIVYALRLYSLILLGRVLSSWVDPLQNTPVTQFLHRATEPVLAPIRRVLPQTGPMDLSPLLVFLLVEVLIRIVNDIRY